MTDDRRKVLVACITRHQLVEFEKRQGRDHCATLPAVVRSLSIKALNEEHVLSGRALEADGSRGDTCFLRQPCGDEFRLHHVVDVILRRELGDELLVAGCNHGLRPRSADRAPIKKSARKLRRERGAFLDEGRRGLKLLEGCSWRRARHIGVGRPLEVQGADAVRAGLQKIGQFVDLRRVGALAASSEYTVDDDAAPPGVGSSIPQAIRHRQSRRQRQDSGSQRQLGLVEGDRVVATEIASPVVEEQLFTRSEQPAGDYRLCLLGQPDPYEGLGRLFVRSCHRALREMHEQTSG